MKELLKDRLMIICMSIAFLITVGMASLVPAIPNLARVFGVSNSYGSLLLTLYTLPGIFFLPIAGFLSDKYGRKKVILPCLMVFSLSGVACGLVTNFDTLLGLRFIQGFAAAPFGMFSNVLMGDRYSGVKLAMALSIGSTAFNISTAISPFLGGSLAFFHWRLIFILPAIGFIVFILCTKETFNYAPVKQAGKDYILASWNVVSSKKIVFLMALAFFNMMFLLGPIMTCMPIFMDMKHNAPPHLIGYFTIFLSAGAAMGAIFVGRSAGNFSSVRLLWTGELFFFFSLLSFPFIDIMWINLFPMFIFGLGLGICTTIAISFTVAGAPPEQRGAVLSAYAMCSYVSQTISPLLFSKIAEYFGIDMAYFIGAACVLFIMCISVAVLWKRRN